jgi:hypothetical protein
VGTIAHTNSCESGWSAPTFDLALVPDARRLRLGKRATARVIVSNITAALDQLLHGNRTRGWGQLHWADPQLLRVTGFDPATQRFRYEVNALFGSTTRTASVLQRPFRLALEARIDIGRDPQAIYLSELFHTRDDAPLTAEQIRDRLGRESGGLRLLISSRQRLQLSDGQRDAFTNIAARVAGARARIVTDLASLLAERQDHIGSRDVLVRWEQAVGQAYGNYIAGIQEAVALLSEDQRARMTTAALTDVLALSRISPADIAAYGSTPHLSIP